VVSSAATDIGTGTYTVMTQLSAELLGLDLDHVRFGLGDSDMPMAPEAGGSGLTAALGTAVHAACWKLVQAFLDQVADDKDSPLRGCRLADATVAGGRIHRTGSPGQNEAYTGILARHGLDELSADGASAPPSPQDAGMAPAGAFAAKFAEVRVDPDLGLLRVARVVSAIDGGRILNKKLARSQIIGGTVGGIGMALLEETITDPSTGRIANATLGDYLVPVNADVPDMDVLFVGEPDPFNPIGVKGVGEVGLDGIAAAIANAVFHATGRRIRSLPITIDRLL
jgi:CO/xanthine dehydrogenase Mo-binding subunit